MVLALSSAGIAVAVVILMVTSIRAATTYYYTLPQFRALGAAEAGRYVQVNGQVAPGVRWNPTAERLAFEVRYAGSTVAPLPVVYHGPEPDTFASGLSVVVAGRLNPQGTFVATQVLVKCPSHYQAAAAGENPAQWSKAG